MPVAYHAERADMRTNGIADVRGERLWLDQEPYLDAFTHYCPPHAACAAFADAPRPQPMMCGA
ncbi:MAG: hypothetical protein Q8K50_03480, partial [Hydrogenophaga sp.]|nr:hypothetical protein [Hydrogenophaga sp.]